MPESAPLTNENLAALLERRREIAASIATTISERGLLLSQVLPFLVDRTGHESAFTQTGEAATDIFVTWKDGSGTMWRLVP